jgi:hypothetical protein
MGAAPIEFTVTRDYDEWLAAERQTNGVRVYVGIEVPPEVRKKGLNFGDGEQPWHGQLLVERASMRSSGGPAYRLVAQVSPPFLPENAGLK